MKQIPLLALASVLGASALPAQDWGRPSVVRDSVPGTIAQAEAEGGRYPRSAEKPSYGIWFDTVATSGPATGGASKLARRILRGRVTCSRATSCRRREPHAPERQNSGSSQRTDRSPAYP